MFRSFWTVLLQYYPFPISKLYPHIQIVFTMWLYCVIVLPENTQARSWFAVYSLIIMGCNNLAIYCPAPGQRPRCVDPTSGEWPRLYVLTANQHTAAPACHPLTPPLNTRPCLRLRISTDTLNVYQQAARHYLQYVATWKTTWDSLPSNWNIQPSAK